MKLILRTTTTTPQTPTPQVIDERRGGTSASNALPDALCQGRHQAQRGLQDVATADSRTGDKIHAALASGDASGLDFAEMETFTACRDIEAKVVSQFFGSEANSLKSWREQRYWVKFKQDVNGAMLEWEHSGRCDVVYRAGNRGLILEYKTLTGDVPASSRNLQLRDQVVLVRGHFLLPEIGAAVIQPLVTHTPEITFYAEPDIDRAAAEMFQRTMGSNMPFPVRTPGDVQCKFCKAKLQCVPYQQWAGGSVPGMSSLLDVPVSAWTLEQCASFWDKSAIAQRWLDDCKESVKARAIAGEAIPGYALKQGAMVTKITDPQACFERFTKLGGTVEQFMHCITVGKTRLGEAIAGVTGAKGVNLKNALAALTEGIVEERRNSPSLVKQEDPQ